jgi:hypothetical protein
MARRNSTTTEATVAETTEATTTEATEAPATEKVEVVVDLTAFQSAVEAAASEADKETGTVPDASISAVQTAYRELPSTKGKNAAKAHLNELMRAAMQDSNIAGARAYMSLSDALTAPAPKAAREPKAPVDPTEGFVAKVAGVQLAYTLVTAEVPEGVAADWSDKVNAALAEAMPQIDAYKAWDANESEDKGDAPELGYVARTALKVAAGKVPGAKSAAPAFTGERRDVGAHITAAFADLESGTFLTVAEIRGHKSAEYGDSAPSAGAISARLFPTSGKTTVEGITPGQNEKGVRGATKA